MLVLTRKVGEEIQIGNNIVIRVIRHQGNRVQLGIVAPDHVSIRRADWTSGDAPEAPQKQFELPAAISPDRQPTTLS